MSNPSLPMNLELNEWLSFSLSSSNEADRQIALEEIITNGSNESLINQLNNIAQNDSSQTCKLQAQWVLKQNEAKDSLKGSIDKLEITPDFIVLQTQKNDFAKINAISQLINKAPQEKTLEQWRAALNTSNDPRVIETGLTILSKFGNKNDAALALKYLEHNDQQVVCAAFSLLAKKDEELLKKNIKTGISNKSVTVLLHCLHLLSTINETEAVKYLNVLLFNNNPVVRQKALREFLEIGFKSYENIYWQYLMREDKSLALIKVCNENIELKENNLYKLYDILAISAGEKRHIIQLLLKKTLEKLQSTANDPNAIVNKLNQYIANKKIEQSIKIASSYLNSEETATRANAIERLAQHISHPQVRALLENQLQKEKDENLKSYLSSLFDDSPDSKSDKNNLQNTSTEANSVSEEKTEENTDSKQSINDTKLTNFPDINSFLKLTTKEQRSYLKKITKIEEYPIAKKTIIEALDCNVKKTVVLEILQIIAKYGNAEDAKNIYHLTKSNDNSFTAQAIRTIGTIDIDRIILDLNTFLAHDDPRIKSAAFEIYANADKEAAIQYAGNMLRNTSVQLRRAALSLLPLLEYTSVEPMLWWALNHENNVELQDQIGYMLAANPTQEGIVKLFEFTHDKNGEIKEGFNDIWNAALLSASNVFNLPAEEIEKNCWDNIISSKESPEESNNTNYKFQSMVGENAKIQEELESNSSQIEYKNIFAKILNHFYVYQVQYICTLIIGVGLYFLVDYIVNSGPSRTDRKDIVSNANFLPGDESSNITTQVGTDGWKGAIKSRARPILQSKQYAQLMQTAAQEREEFRIEAEKKLDEYYKELANDPNVEQEERDWAAANLNANFKYGNKAYDKENYEEAERYFMKAADDPSLNSYGKMLVLDKLVELSDMKRDKASWMKWMDRYMKEIRKGVPEFKQVEFMDKFPEVFTKMESFASELRKSPEAQKELRAKLMSEKRLTPAEADEAVDNILNFKHPFDK